jgi:hypothetical protein
MASDIPARQSSAGVKLGFQSFSAVCQIWEIAHKPIIINKINPGVIFCIESDFDPFWQKNYQPPC